MRKLYKRVVCEDGFSIVWVGGEIKGTRILHNFHPDEFEVISEGR